MGFPSNPELGWYYVVNVAGEIGGVMYEVGDWIVWNGTSWDRIAGNRIVNLNQILTRSHADLQDIGSGDHHPQITNLTQITTREHVALQGIGENDHHAQIVNLTQVTTREHVALQNIGENDHHPRVHGDEAHSSDMGYLFYKGGWDASGG